MLLIKKNKKNKKFKLQNFSNIKFFELYVSNESKMINNLLGENIKKNLNKYKKNLNIFYNKILTTYILTRRTVISDLILMLIKYIYKDFSLFLKKVYLKSISHFSDYFGSNLKIYKINSNSVVNFINININYFRYINFFKTILINYFSSTIKLSTLFNNVFDYNFLFVDSRVIDFKTKNIYINGIQVSKDTIFAMGTRKLRPNYFKYAINISNNETDNVSLNKKINEV